MNLEAYFNRAGNGVSFTREQASNFAKGVADDFNPIHDVDAKRFCVPGDLLFAVALSELGISEKLHVTFADMVGDGIDIGFQRADDQHLDVVDDAGKTYLKLAISGDTMRDADAISSLIEQYVAFSGKTFPHVLVALWKEQNVMVNPARPLVIYESMSLDMSDLNFSTPTLEFTGSSLEVNGKRGNVSLNFEFKEGDRLLGKGEKRMILSGLKPYDQEAIDNLIDFYNDRKERLAV
ncbi:MAG: DUF3581 domain-containing protein [Candidatus Pelagadaptatus aseana]|uniref:DUF3581 family protein n=1 Tax=Candidatus Pelagadaptatus aseana TaxID=3120508 RepID=UPI0039B2D56B